MESFADLGLECIELIGDDGEKVRITARFADLHSKRVAIRFVDVGRAERLTDAPKLTSTGQHGNTRAARDMDHADAKARKKADLSCIEGRTLGEEQGSLRAIRAKGSDILEGCCGGAKQSVAVLGGDIFLDDDGIGPIGDGSACKDPRTFAAFERGGGLGSGDVLEDRKGDRRSLGSLGDIGVVKGVAVHCRSRKARHGKRRMDGFTKQPSCGFVERKFFGVEGVGVREDMGEGVLPREHTGFLFLVTSADLDLFSVASADLDVDVVGMEVEGRQLVLQPCVGRLGGLCARSFLAYGIFGANKTGVEGVVLPAQPLGVGSKQTRVDAAQGIAQVGGLASDGAGNAGGALFLLGLCAEKAFGGPFSSGKSGILDDLTYGKRLGLLGEFVEGQAAFAQGAHQFGADE